MWALGHVTGVARLFPDLTRQVLNDGILIHAHAPNMDMRASQTNWRASRWEYSTTY